MGRVTTYRCVWLEVRCQRSRSAAGAYARRRLLEQIPHTVARWIFVGIRGWQPSELLGYYMNYLPLKWPIPSALVAFLPPLFPFHTPWCTHKEEPSDNWTRYVTVIVEGVSDNY